MSVVGVVYVLNFLFIVIFCSGFAATAMGVAYKVQARCAALISGCVL